ncbi:hypothetical protein ACFPFV_00225 [Salinicoccus siamensis]
MRRVDRGEEHAGMIDFKNRMLTRLETLYQASQGGGYSTRLYRHHL